MGHPSDKYIFLTSYDILPALTVQGRGQAALWDSQAVIRFCPPEAYTFGNKVVCNRNLNLSGQAFFMSPAEKGEGGNGSPRPPQGPAQHPGAAFVGGGRRRARRCTSPKYCFPWVCSRNREKPLPSLWLIPKADPSCRDPTPPGMQPPPSLVPAGLSARLMRNLLGACAGPRDPVLPKRLDQVTEGSS